MTKVELEDIIDKVRQDKGDKPNSSIKKLRIILKAFLQYSTTEDTLPPPTLIPVCLFSVPNLLKTLSGLQDGHPLQEQPSKTGLRLSIHLYLKGLLRLFMECEAEIRPIVVQSMTKSVEFLPIFSVIAKKWVRSLVESWSTCSEDLPLGLRVFLCLQRILQQSEEDFLLWGLRRVYVGFFEHCGQVSWRTLEHINFMGNCFCQLARINPSKTYYVLFGYIRAIAMQIQSLNNAKGKQKIELISKLYSQQIIQVLRLMGKAIGQAGEEVSALIYPLCQLLIAFQSISEANEYLPLKMHILNIQLTLMEHTGIYIPHSLEIIVKIFSCAPLRRKNPKKSGFQGSLDLGYKLSAQELKNTNVLNAVFDKALFYFYWFCVIAEKSIGGAEILQHSCKLIHKIELGFTGHKKALKNTIKIIKEDARRLTNIRRKKGLRLNDQRIDKIEALLAKKELGGQLRYRQLLEERQQMFKARVQAEQDQPEEEDDQEGIQEDQLESGWEEASEGASEFDQKQDEEEEEGQQLQSVSYEGDPQDPEQAVKQWSEHEWSSQQEAIVQ